MRFLKTQNKNKSLVFFLIFSIVTIYSYAQEKKVYWDNGNLKSITNHDEGGNKTGYWKTFYENGKLETSGYYNKGKKLDNWDEYYPNGTKKKRTNYYDGLMSSTSTFYENGNTMISGSFDGNQAKDGFWSQYYNNWQQKIRGEYAHGRKHGKWEYYRKNGKVYKIENYKLGILNSKWDGNHLTNNNYESEVVSVVEAAEKVEEVEIIEVVESAEDVVEAAAAAVDAASDAADAVVETSSHYGNRENGEWKFYNENGKMIEIGNYLNDGKDGKWIYYYDNGQLKKEQVWKKGKLMEVTTYFDENGKPLDRGTLKSGSGTVKEYEPDGKFISTVEYSFGEELDWNDWSKLNTLAWRVYENEGDSDTLNQAITWVKRSIKLDKNYYNTDTYAALLYKTGKNKQALSLAKQAIEIAKKDKEEYSSTTELIGLIKKEMKN